MANALVHLGLHKTGSTYLQSLMSGAKVALREQGIAVLGGSLRLDVRALLAESKKKPASSMVPFLSRLFSGRESGLIWQPHELKRKLELTKAGQHLLISDESYEAFGRFPATLENFDRILRKRVDRVQYKVVVRQFADHAASHFQEQIKALQVVHYRGTAARLLDYSLDARLGAFADLGKPLSVVDFDAMIKGDTPSHLNEWLSEAFGTGPVAIADSKVTNPSLGQEGVAFMMTLAQLIRMASGKKAKTIHAWPNFRRVRAITVPAARANLRVSEPFFPFPEDVQVKSTEQARKRAKKIIDAFGGPWVDVVFRQQTRPFGRVLLSELSEERRRYISELVLDVWSKIDPILRLDMVLDGAFDAKHALSHFIEHERELLL